MTTHIDKQDYIFMQAAAIRRCAAADLVYVKSDSSDKLLLKKALIERMESCKYVGMITPDHHSMSETLESSIKDTLCCISYGLLSEVIEVMEVKEIIDREKTLSMEDLYPKMTLMDLVYPRVLLDAVADTNKGRSHKGSKEKAYYKIKQMKGEECEQIDIFHLDKEMHSISPMWHYRQSESGECLICSVLRFNIMLNKKTDMELIINV